jgi:hypothetical protein
MAGKKKIPQIIPNKKSLPRMVISAIQLVVRKIITKNESGGSESVFF